MQRHFTVSGFVVHEGRVALHWHRKNGAWLPAGGHLEPGEDPIEATLREIREEFAIEAEVMRLAPGVVYDGGPAQLQPPYTILICHSPPDHEHIDHVYFCRVLSGYPGVPEDPASPVIWFDAAAIEAGAAPHDGTDVPFAPDVRALALEALRLAAAPPQRLIARRRQRAATAAR